MDLHVYRNSQDRWHDLRIEARARGAVLATNAVTLDELVRRLTPRIEEATPGQRLALLSAAFGDSAPVRYALDAFADLKGAGITAAHLRKAGASDLAKGLETYSQLLEQAGLTDPQDRRWLAATAVREAPWLRRFESVTLHALYDLNPAEFALLHNVIERLPSGGAVMLFNATTNIKPTQFAEWTWQRFVNDEALSDKTFPEFVRSSGPAEALLDRLFVFDAPPAEPLSAHGSPRIIQCSGRYGEIEFVGAEVSDLLDAGADPGDVAVVVRHIDTYGEMIEDVFSRYGIDCVFETGVPLLRVPFIKYWMAFLDLVSSERPRDAMARVFGSAYRDPRITPKYDPERMLAEIGYIDRRYLSASALAARHHSPLAAQIEQFELLLDGLEKSSATPGEFLARLQPATELTSRDFHAWTTLSEELEAVSRLTGVIAFEHFRRLASETAGLRTVDRFSSRPAAFGSPGVRIVPPRALGYRSYRWLFAPGFADGEIPASSSANPLLPDELVEELNRLVGRRTLQNSRSRNRKEPLYLFLLLDSAADRVTITCPANTLEGEPIHPSIYVGEILRHYDAAGSLIGRAPASKPREGGELRREIAAAWNRGLIEDHHAADLLGEGIVRRARWERRGSDRGDLAAGVLPTNVVFSPTELDKLEACPFVFLARHRLKLRSNELPDFEVSPLEVGILAHAILREFYSRPVGSSEAEARAWMEEVVARQLSAVDVFGQGAVSVIDPALWRIRRPQLVRALLEYVKFAVRDALDGYETLPEFLDEPFPAARLGHVSLAGRPDRVAVRRDGARLTGIRIDDFKYSAASSGTKGQLQRSFQIPIYAHLAAEALAAGPEVPIEGRYVLLRSPSSPALAQAVDRLFLDEIRERVDGLVHKIQLGHLHPEPADIEDCKDCDYRRLCRIYGS